MPSGGLLFLAVPDGAVRDTAARVARMGPPEGLSVVHVSGALGLDALEPLRGHPVGSFHPLQSFPAPRGPEAFRGITVAVDASAPSLMARLKRLARSIGARPRHVRDSERVLYHAAAVFASNYLIASVAEGVRLLEAAGWQRAEAEAALVPLVEGVMANLRRRGVVKALTGPVRRGDAETVARHLAEVENADLYRMLGLAALRIAVEAGLEPLKAEQTSRALTRNVAATRRRSRG
jgi:predicted short-subunit dehydrogenase-like oxidoreductase (DUF2520 family)